MARLALTPRVCNDLSKGEPVKLLSTIVLVVCLAACSDPKDIVLGQEPLKQMLEKPEAFKRLPESDRSMLVGYLMAQQMGRAFGGASTPDNVTGKTVGEVLIAATKWRDGMEVMAKAELQRKSELEARKAKVEAERQSIVTRIASQVTVTVVDKKVIPMNRDRFQFSDYLKIDFDVRNNSDKAIRQLKGSVVFADAVGDIVGSLKVDFDKPITGGQTLRTDTGGGWKLNQFMNGSVEKIAARDFSAMQAKFEPTSIALEGGEVLRVPAIPE